MSDSQGFIISYALARMCVRLSLLVCRCPVGALHFTLMFLSVRWLSPSLSESLSFRRETPACVHLCKHVCARARKQELWKRRFRSLTQPRICSSELNGSSRWGGLLSCSDCCAHMDSGLVRPSILVAAARPPRWTCAVPCVYTRSLASVGNVYPAEVQQCCALSQLYWTDWKGSHLGHMYWPISDMSRLPWAL